MDFAVSCFRSQNESLINLFAVGMVCETEILTKYIMPLLDISSQNLPNDWTPECYAAVMMSTWDTEHVTSVMRDVISRIAQTPDYSRSVNARVQVAVINENGCNLT